MLFSPWKAKPIPPGQAPSSTLLADHPVIYKKVNTTYPSGGSSYGQILQSSSTMGGEHRPSRHMDILPNVHVSLGVGWNGWDEMIYSSRYGFLLVEVPYTGSAVLREAFGLYVWINIWLRGLTKT